MVWDKLKTLWVEELPPKIKTIKTRFELIEEHESSLSPESKASLEQGIQDVKDGKVKCLEIPGVAHSHIFINNICNTCGDIETGISQKEIQLAQINHYKSRLNYLNLIGQFPHCNNFILHAPSTCSYCDKHPDWQIERIDKKVCFTGATVIFGDHIQCPADAIFQVSAKNKWPGNQAQKV